jgi:hypothetical protein
MILRRIQVAVALQFRCKCLIQRWFSHQALQSTNDPDKACCKCCTTLNVICLGPQRTKIHRYLLVVCLAKSTPMFSLWGKEIDNSIYFTLYKLWQVADSFKQIKPYHLPIHYDRTKVAIRIYTMISNNDLVDIRKIEGETYITITEKGEDISTKLLQDLIAYEELTNCVNKTDSDEKFNVKKGGIGYDPLQKVERKLAERISGINLPFEDELKTIEED